MEDIRKPVLPFVRLFSVRHRISLFYSIGLSPTFVEVIHYRTRFHYLYCFFDNFSLSKLFVPIKVRHSQISGIYIRCA